MASITPLPGITDSRAPKPGGMREMLLIAVPMIASNACDTVMTFTDRLFLSRLGSQYMNAAMAGGLTAFMFTTFFLGLIGYSTALVAQYLGSGQRKQCTVAVAQACIVALVAWPIVFALTPVGHWLFTAMKIEPAQLEPQKQYFDILMAGSVLGLLRGCLSGFFSGIGRTRIVMVASFAAMGVNVLANYVLIFGKWGAPALGIQGAAYGTLIGGASGIAMLLAGYFAPKIRTEFSPLQGLRYDRQVMGKLVRFGYPAGLELFLNLIAFDLLILVFHSRGLEAATAVTVVFNWDLVSFLPLIGVHIAVTSLVGRYMGAGQPDIAHRATMSGLRLAWIYGTCMLLIFFFFAHLLVGVFRPPVDAEIFDKAMPAAIVMLKFAVIYVLGDAMSLVFSGALRGAGDTFWAMVISVGLHWMLVVVLAIMLKVFYADVQTAWAVLAFTIILFSGVFYLRYRSGAWRNIQVVQPAVA